MPVLPVTVTTAVKKAVQACKGAKFTRTRTMLSLKTCYSHTSVGLNGSSLSTTPTVITVALQFLYVSGSKSRESVLQDRFTHISLTLDPHPAQMLTSDSIAQVLRYDATTSKLVVTNSRVLFLHCHPLFSNYPMLSMCLLNCIPNLRNIDCFQNEKKNRLEQDRGGCFCCELSLVIVIEINLRPACPTNT